MFVSLEDSWGPTQANMIYDEFISVVKRLAADYPDAPLDLGGWIVAPPSWPELKLLDGEDVVAFGPHQEDRHGGLAFRVGWSERLRIAAIWF